METILNFFFNEGILGILVAGNILVIIYLYRKLESCRQDCLEAAQQATEMVRKLQDEKTQLQKEHMGTLMEIQGEVNAVTTKLTNTMEALIVALTKGVE